MKIHFTQVISCVTDITESKAHERMDAVKKVTTGLLGISADGNLYSYNYITKKWDEFPSNWSTL